MMQNDMKNLTGLTIGPVWSIVEVPLCYRDSFGPFPPLFLVLAVADICILLAASSYGIYITPTPSPPSTHTHTQRRRSREQS